MRGIVKVCAVKAPDYGDRKTLLLEDMAILTGGQVISRDKGYKLDKLTPAQLTSFLGTARTATVSKDETTIIDGSGKEEAIVQRAGEIKDQIEKATSFFEKEKLQERLGKLVGGVAIISVGGNSDIEIRERKDRVEDALFATKAALIEGVVPGGGIALIEALNGLSTNPKEMSADQTRGYEIVKKACFAPFKVILRNCGIDDYYTILRNLSDKQTGDGKVLYAYNAKTGEIVDAAATGLLDPAKVTRTALENAASVAGTILTTESVIFEKKAEKDNNNAGMDMMGGMM